MQNITEVIKDKLSIYLVVSEKVALKKQSNGQYKGLCPFHKEKTPSFYVDNNKNSFHCFGCGESGDIFSFVEKYFNYSFKEALNFLAGKASVKITDFSVNKEEINENKILYEILEETTKFFEDNLHKTEGSFAKNYLLKRGIKEETIKEFRLGYSLNQRNVLLNHLENKGFTKEFLLKAGIIGQNQDNTYYEIFRNRVMFPIFDKNNKAIAFGARTLDGGEPKYLNSKETPIFSKRNVLYNFNKAILNLRNNNIIVAEGYLDVISFFQYGFKSSVAPLGTALSIEQINNIKKYDKSFIFCLDGDSAGVNAAVKSTKLILPELDSSYNIRFITLPDNHDPDSYLRENGEGGFLKVLKTAVPFSNFLYNSLVSNKNLSSFEGKQTAIKEIEESCQSIKDFSFRKNLIYDFKNRVYNRSSKKITARVNDNLNEFLLIAIILNNPDIYLDVDELIGLVEFENKELNNLRQEIINILDNDSLDSENLYNKLVNSNFSNILKDIEAKKDVLDIKNKNTKEDFIKVYNDYNVITRTRKDLKEEDISNNFKLIKDLQDNFNKKVREDNG